MVRQRHIKVAFLVLVVLICIITVCKHFLILRMNNIYRLRKKEAANSKFKHVIYSHTETFSKLINLAQVQLILNVSLENWPKDTPLMFTNKRKYIARDINYFDEVNRLGNMKTLLLNFTRTLYLRILPPRWYIVHSNNCTKMAYESKGFTSAKKPKCQQTATYTYLDICKLNVSSLRSKSVFRKGTIPHFPLLDTENLIVDYLHVLRDAVVFPTGDVITSTTHIQPYGCQAPTATNTSMLRVTSVHDQVVTISQQYGANFFHFLVEDLPRIVLLLPFLRKNKSVKIHVYRHQWFMRNFLRDLGLSPRRLVWGVTGARTLYMPSGSRCGRPSILPVNILSLYLREHVRPVPRRSIVVIKRSTKRWFHQHNAILSMLWEVAEMFSLRVEVFSDTALPAYEITRRTFHRALVVVAPHGAGLTNLVFSRPGTCVVEGLCHDADGKVNLCFRDLAFVLGHVYHGILPTVQCVDMQPKDFRSHVEQCVRHMLTTVTTGASTAGCV